MPVFSIHRHTKPLVSGSGLFNLKLKHKGTSFQPNIHTIINIEELNSGLYALKRLSSALQSDGCTHASTLLNPNNKLLPSLHPKSPKHSETSSSYTGKPIDQIIKEGVYQLSVHILQQTQALQEALPELSLSDWSDSITSTLVSTLQVRQTDPLTETQLTLIFQQMKLPSETILLKQIEQYLAPILDQKCTEIKEELSAKNASEDEIQLAIQQYKEKSIQDYFLTHVKPYLHTYAESIVQPLLNMLSQLQLAVITQQQTITPDSDNVETVNGKIVLQAMLSGVNTLLTKAPELASNASIIHILSLQSLTSKPTLTAEELSNIYAASDTPTSDVLVEFTTKKDVAAYKEGITKAFETAVLNLNNVRLTISDQQKKLEETLAVAQQIQLCFENFVQGAQRLFDNKNITTLKYLNTEEYLQMYSSLTSLSQMYNTSSHDMQTLLKQYVPQVQNLQPDSNVSKTLDDMMAEVAAYIEISRVCLRATIKDASNIVPFLKEKGTTLQKYQFLGSVGSILNTYTATQVTNLTQTGVGGYLIPKGNDFFNQNSSLSTQPDSTFVNKAKGFLQQFQTGMTAYKLNLQTQLSKLEKRYEELNPGTASFTNDRTLAVKDWLKSESLGSAFIFLIQNSQLPKQRTFLEPLIKEVNFNNLAANAINDLLQITNAFSTSSVYYNFSSFLIESKEGKDLFNGDYFETSMALAKEREFISRDQARCQRASAVVQELLNKIQNSPNVSEAQKQQMLNATRMYEQVLSITSDQLIVLDSLLVNLKIEPQQDSTNQHYRPDLFKITGPDKWISLLADLEGFLSNGYPNVSPSGGLGPLFTLIQSDQQNYITQGQTQQLNLQNQMTNVQQEWTLVSTSMQVLNKLLSHLAGEINR